MVIDRVEEFPTLVKVAYDLLKKTIVKNRMKTGIIYKELVIAKEMGMSKTPVHDALTMLETRGFVRILPRRGFEITNLTIKTVSDLYEFRRPLERTVIFKVVPNITSEQLDYMDILVGNLDKSKETLEYQEADRAIHRYLSDLTENQFLIKSLDMVWDLSDWIGMKILQNENSLDTWKEHHNTIHQWILLRDPDRAWKVLLEHMNLAEKRFIENFNE